MYKPGRDSSPEPDGAITLILDFQPPEQQEINFCCLSHLWLNLCNFLQQPELTKTTIKKVMDTIYKQKKWKCFIFQKQSKETTQLNICKPKSKGENIKELYLEHCLQESIVIRK